MGGSRNNRIRPSSPWGSIRWFLERYRHSFGFGTRNISGLNLGDWSIGLALVFSLPRLLLGLSVDAV